MYETEAAMAAAFMIPAAVVYASTKWCKKTATPDNEVEVIAPNLHIVPNDLRNMKDAELKDALQSAGLSTTGIRPTLMKRLKSHMRQSSHSL